jgi:hypothetical protein
MLVSFSFSMDCRDHRDLDAGMAVAEILSSSTLLREIPEQLRKKPRKQPTNKN